MRVEYFNISTNHAATDDFVTYSLERTRSLPLLDLRYENYIDCQSKDLIEHIATNFEYYLIIGMGGASLNPKMYKAFKDNPKVFVIDNLDAFVVDNILSQLNLSKTAVISISKSGYTYETICLTEYVINKFQKSGVIIKDKLFAITNTDTKLYNIINLHGGKSIPHKMNINGRFCTFSNVGFLMSKLIGFEYKEILFYAKEYYEKLFDKRNIGFIKNFLSFHSNHDSQVLFTYGNVVNVASKWLAQIFAESSGKNANGLTPICSEGPMDQHSQLQLYLEGPKNKTFHLMLNSPYESYQDLASSMFKEYDILESLFVEDGYPVKKTFIDRMCEQSFAEFVMLNIMECILYCWFVGSNPFSQPSVDKIKRMSKELL
ncbi:MAG: hypothetical protein J0G32_06835 [Alphaproteobacteria bacterium]|nr:hypothetical protein [Alphaproteobacteria bacterium]OJV14189.1 MAG: hypothetical protein BGO27_01665 [Alphaproteobacteria bacterium 33-17]